MRRIRTMAAVAAALTSAFGVAGCRREQRRFAEPASTSSADAMAKASDYSKNAWAMGEGQRLFAQMNCAGCHSHGGGGMGPALMDAQWVYGGDLPSIETSIIAGRPNGMPAYGSRLTEQQVWQVAAYVRSLSGHAPSAAEPIRDDHMSVRPPLSRTDPEPFAKQED
jgi:cytochrome c oxidase cbb3-type subunit 3